MVNANDGVRSSKMSKIKGRDTKPEILVRKFLFSRGFRYRIHCKKLPGKPDIVLTKYRTVILVNGCFWHAHNGCRLNKIPRSNVEFWTNKLQSNMQRDKENEKGLEKLGWKVITIWECQLRKPHLEQTLVAVISVLKPSEV
ncbi:very short patch repair endonuclease [Nemorincola caseinilytica]|uniref:Very short patch repair endonuclease n=2 Tax=Nemorincola caseinilytica TaxID=2054315 RepID=A0ABP8NDV2_9BACT